MLNNVTFQGRLVADPACGTTNSGTDYANLRLAWSERYKERENKCFLDCKAFGQTAKFIQNYFNRKGQEMLVEGRLQTEEWEKDGEKRSRLVLMIDRVHFCGKRENNEAGAAQPAMTQVELADGELPF